MLNNKGFAVSSVLYTLLIAFLLFLGAALAQFSSSSSLIGKANDDIVNGTQFEAVQVKPNGACTKDDDRNVISKWYQDDNGDTSNTIVRIKSRYGMVYWPKDFKYDSGDLLEIGPDGGVNFGTTTSINGKIKVEAQTSNVGSEVYKLKIYYTEDTAVVASYGNAAMSDDASYMGIYNICE